jgi:hypothetical protein
MKTDLRVQLYNEWLEEQGKIYIESGQRDKDWEKNNG